MNRNPDGSDRIWAGNVPGRTQPEPITAPDLGGPAVDRAEVVDAPLSEAAQETAAALAEHARLAGEIAAKRSEDTAELLKGRVETEPPPDKGTESDPVHERPDDDDDDDETEPPPDADGRAEAEDSDHDLGGEA